jgi:hypothetical protein
VVFSCPCAIYTMINDADVTNDEDFLTYIEADCCKKWMSIDSNVPQAIQ